MFESLLELNFGDITLGVIQKNPLFEYDEEEEAEVVTSQEADIDDEAVLDEKIEDSSPLTA